MKGKMDLFLDSGAFSAWQRGETLQVEDYIKFIKEYDGCFGHYSVLDIIGDAEGTLRNQHIMEEAGLQPIPCYHYGEPTKYLEHYLANYDYIAIGGLAKNRTRDEIFNFLDHAFDVICDARGIPVVRVHGFGLSSLRVLFRYPWYSVDSTSWLLGSRVGYIFVPRKLPNGEWDYMETLPGQSTRRIRVAAVCPGTPMPYMHIETLGKKWRSEVEEWLEQHGIQMGRTSFRPVLANYVPAEGEQKVRASRARGQSYLQVAEVVGVSNSYAERDVLNAMYFKELEEHFPPWPWAWKRPTMMRL